jgi:hypothetical protein
MIQRRGFRATAGIPLTAGEKSLFSARKAPSPRPKTAVYHSLGYDSGMSTGSGNLGSWQRIGSGIWPRNQILLSSHYMTI